MTGIRASLHRQLSPEAWQGRGISPLNRLVIVFVTASIALAILQSEPIIATAVPRLILAVDLVFAIVFAAEFGLRLWSAAEDDAQPGGAGRLRFLFTFSSMADLAALAAIWIDVVSGVPGVGGVVLRLGRVVRVATLTRRSRIGTALRFLKGSLARRSTEIYLAFSLGILILLVSSVLLYLVEREVQPEAFGSIPRAMWWAVATLTTVGYGDVYPISALGKVLAGVTSLTSIAVIAMPAGIMAAVFSNAIQSFREDGDWE